MLRNLLIASFLAACASAAEAQGPVVTANSMGMLYGSSVLTANVPQGQPVWGVAALYNSTTSPIMVSWTLTLDGAQISYGEWNLSAQSSALLTAISASQFATATTHSLVLSYTDSAGDQVTQTVKFASK